MVSLKRLDSGSISVFDSDPSENLRSLGYMPQDTTSLHPIFTIRETFSFFGRLYGMEKEGIDKRSEFLAQFLQLPDLSKMIMTLR
jgi:ABC-type multidrug transport system ATPase subunit